MGWLRNEGVPAFRKVRARRIQSSVQRKHSPALFTVGLLTLCYNLLVLLSPDASYHRNERDFFPFCFILVGTTVCLCLLRSRKQSRVCGDIRTAR